MKVVRRPLRGIDLGDPVIQIKDERCSGIRYDHNLKGSNVLYPGERRSKIMVKEQEEIQEWLLEEVSVVRR